MMVWVRKIHKWASLLVGLQMLIWVGSGIAFNMLDHKKASGNTYRAQATYSHTTNATTDLLPVEQILDTFPNTIELKHTSLLAQSYYLLTTQKGLYRRSTNTYTLVNALTGAVTSIDQKLASAIAKASYQGPGEITSVNLLLNPSDDFPKFANPSWQVNFDDELATTVYVEQGSGSIIGHANSNKRFADFVFMLHFMDYNQAGSFNNVQIILFAFVTLWLTLSGLIWTIYMLSNGKFRLKKW